MFVLPSRFDEADKLRIWLFIRPKRTFQCTFFVSMYFPKFHRRSFRNNINCSFTGFYSLSLSLC